MSVASLKSRFEPTKATKAVDSTEIVCRMPSNSEARAFASNAGLLINAISWEDNARYKNSSWGPCISDMTLSVGARYMPLIKNTSNFNDESWDVEIEKIPLVVGNENDSTLRTVTLKEYLGNLREYLHAPSKWLGTAKSLLIPDKDQHVICSAQACFLPIPADGDAKFNVTIRNYQSRAKDPAVLAIVASANGTSAQVLTSSTKIPLYHNNNGQRASYVGQRLSDYRRETDSSLGSDAPMTVSEKSQNMLLVIQVPLKQGPPPSAKPKKVMKKMDAALAPKCRAAPEKSRVDVESAIISVGQDEGPFAEIGGFSIERDPRFPVRVTMQFYKATSNGAVNDEVMQDIASELQGARKWAVAISSLVNETTNRTTEHGVERLSSVSINTPPSWWNEFWNEHSVVYGNWSAHAASSALIAHGLFASSSLENVREQVIDVFRRGPILAPSVQALLAE